MTKTAPAAPTEVGPEVLWKGAPALRPFLVPLEDFESFPGNPRRGAVADLRASLRRFGQVLPALIDPTLGADGKQRLVARHHLAIAAAEEGWTHLAAIPNEFESEDEARAYLVADNRLPELGGYDDVALSAQLAALRDLEGTGYTDADRVELATRLALMRQPTFPETDDVPSLDSRSGTTGLFEVPLYLDVDARKDFVNLEGMLRREWAAASKEEVVLRAMREAAARA